MIYRKNAENSTSSKEKKLFFRPSLNQHKKKWRKEEDGQQIIEKINRMMTAKKVFILSLEKKRS